MSLLDADALGAAADAAILLPPPAPTARPERSAWSAPFRGLAGGAAKLGAAAIDAADAALKTAGENDKFGNPRPDYRPTAKTVRDFERGIRPDPDTANMAEKMLYGLTSVVTEAAPGALAAGPWGAAATIGAAEGTSAAADLPANVDPATRLKVGVIAGGLSGLGAVVPVVGSTLGRTAGLYVAGGPGSFVAQQVATREVLRRADYADLAQQYDPLDGEGLMMSMVPGAPFAGFRAWQLTRGARAGAPAAPGARIEPTLEAGTPAVTPEAIDAAMVHNLVLQRESHASRMPGVGHPDLLRLPEEQRAAMAGMYEAAARAKPLFDEAVSDLAASIGGEARLSDLKRSGRAVDKVLLDYGGDPTKIKDVLRATVVVDSADGARLAVARLFERFDVLPEGRRNLLDAASESADGYRDAKFNVRIGDHIAEVQINIPEMVAAKKKAHPLYKERTDLIREAEARGDLVMPPRVAELNALMRAIYEPAWAAATKARNAASDTGAPFLRADSAANERGAAPSQATPSDGGTPAPSDTGMPSTSKNSADAGNVAGSSSAVDAGFMSASGSIIGENPRGGKSPDLGRLADAFAQARAALDDFIAAGGKGGLHEFMAARGVSAEVNNLAVGLADAAGSPGRLAGLVQQVAREASQQFKSAPDAAADAVEGMRALTFEQIADLEKPPAKPSADPLTQSVTDRLTVIEQTQPDMPIRMDDDGNPITLADEMARIRREAQEGTETELGALDADLLRVAADCALSGAI
jgi:hypothetical protein